MAIIMDKLKNGIELNKEEQDILGKEYKLSRLKIVSSKISVIIFALLQVGILIFVLAKMGMIAGGTLQPTGKRISVLPLDKPITDTYSDKYSSKLIQLNEDKDVKSIIISMRSPGGTPSASWHIAEVVKSLQKENKKPIYIYVESAAVSGSYMIASQSDKIYANPFSIVGSIGVIMNHIVFEKLSKKLGVQEETLTSGKYKRVMSSFELMTDEHKKYIQETLLDKTYDEFIKVVAEGRKKDIKQIEEVAEGRIFIANDEKVKGVLVDEVIGWSAFKDKVYADNNFTKEKHKMVLEAVDNETAGLFGNLIGSANFNVTPSIEANNILNKIN